MNCTMCGAVVPDGSSVCPMCGANLIQYQQPNQGFSQQPMGGQPMGGQPMGGQPMGGQPMGGQPMGGYQQPMGQPMGGYQQPMGGYRQPAYGGMGMGFGGGSGRYGNSPVSSKFTTAKFIQILGAFLIFFSPLLNWVSMRWKDNPTSGSMLKLGIDKGVFTFYAVMIFIFGAFLIFIEAADANPSLQSVKQSIVNIPFIELIVLVLVLVFVLLAFFNGDLMDSIKEYKDELKDSDVRGYATHGFGAIAAFLGLICAAIPRIIRMTGKQID